MANGWTPERRARQAELIRTWKPWERATGPRTEEGKARTARNGFKGGHWLKLRELMKVANALFREQRESLGRVNSSDRRAGDGRYRVTRSKNLAD